MNLELARVNAARTQETPTAPALELQRRRNDQPPVNRVQLTSATCPLKSQSCTRRRGNLAIWVVTWCTTSNHSEEV